MKTRRDWAKWGARLELRRTRKGWTQEALATRLGVTRLTIARLEAGVRRPSVELVERLARVFKLKIETLLGRPR